MAFWLEKLSIFRRSVWSQILISGALLYASTNKRNEILSSRIMFWVGFVGMCIVAFRILWIFVISGVIQQLISKIINSIPSNFDRLLDSDHQLSRFIAMLKEFSSAAAVVDPATGRILWVNRAWFRVFDVEAPCFFSQQASLLRALRHLPDTTALSQFLLLSVTPQSSSLVEFPAARAYSVYALIHPWLWEPRPASAASVVPADRTAHVTATGVSDTASIEGGIRAESFSSELATRAALADDPQAFDAAVWSTRLPRTFVISALLVGCVFSSNVAAGGRHIRCSISSGCA